jgi:anti-sigma factor RsiW
VNCRQAIDIMGGAIDGNLQPTLRIRFEKHITECAPCGTYLEHLHLTRKALQLVARSGATSPHREELIEAFRRGSDSQ